ncbi:hypothetical protein F5X96DRAFT_692943 [Biscogniauxia mediterranea]|nr:hypothetical protein F5X96DRAFT_692943 [Biscogniauxia mediterranea]
MTNWDVPPNAAGGGYGNTWNDGGDTFNDGGAASMNGHGEDNFGRGGGGGGGGACFNCGEEGHTKVDCPNPRVFSGECRVCNKEGHMAKDCPEKPAQVCRNCQEEGHMAAECTNQRKLDRSDVPEVAQEIAWENIRQAIKEQDMDDIKAAVQQYVKACPTIEYHMLEAAFRAQKFGLYLIAVEKPAMLDTFTNMDLQGNLGKKYTVTYRFSDKPARPREAQWWPKSAEDNLERLKDAGDVVQRGLPKCSNCNKLGHISKNCPEEKIEKQRVVIQCIVCNEIGHRARDCTQPRVDKFACKNCGQSGHKAAPSLARLDQTWNVTSAERRATSHETVPKAEAAVADPEDATTVEKKVTRHETAWNRRRSLAATVTRKAIDRTNVQSPRTWPRFNAATAMSMDTLAETAPSLAICSNCGEMGHTKVRCTKPTAPPGDNFDSGNTGDFNNAHGFDNAFAANESHGKGRDDFKAGAADAWQTGASAGSGGNTGWGTGAGSIQW